MFQPGYVLGLDVGGTSTRALLADLEGRRLGHGRAGGGNPTSRGQSTATGNVLDAVQQALGATDPARISAVVMGIAGVLALANDKPTTLFDHVWRQAGLNCRVELVGDATVAFTAGTFEPDGTVLIAGTGAIASAVKGFEPTKRCDGYGWLLGDRGSGVWLGVEAVYAALRHSSGTGPGGRLVESVVADLSPQGARDVNSLIHHAMLGEPVGLSRLAPLVTEAAADEDPVAVGIAQRSAQELAASVSAVRAAQEGTPIVLAGSLATGDNVVSHALRGILAERFSSAEVHFGLDGAAGAAWRAARTLLAEDQPRLQRLHELLVRN